MTSSDQEIWCIVCTELHAAFGLFRTEKAATLAAVNFTTHDKEGCVYMPVQMMSNLTVMNPGESNDNRDNVHHGYL